MLGVATLIIVMSVMNGFRIDLLDKLLSYQPHISVQSKGNYYDERKIILNLAKKNKIRAIKKGNKLRVVPSHGLEPRTY